MIQVSVIVPVYNSARHIRACLEGLLAQEYPRDGVEIILIDNNSTDASRRIVQEYPEITLLEERSQGAYAARNRGLRHARGELIAFTDADCVPSRDWLRECVSALREPGVGIILGGHRFARESFLLSLLADYEHEQQEYIFNQDDQALYFGRTGNMAVRRELFDQLGPFARRGRGADTLFVRRCVERYGCAAVRYCPQVRVRHLEIDGLRQLYRKYLVYGASRRRYGRLVPVRSLSSRERLQVFRNLVARQQLSVAQAATCFGLLTVGVGCSLLGSAGVATIGRRVDGGAAPA